MKIALTICITAILVCAAFVFVSLGKDWKVMKTGSSICRINARTGETFVLANRDGMEWVRVEKNKRKEITGEELDALPVVK